MKEESMFPYGPLTFRNHRDFGTEPIRYMIVPEGYLVQEVNHPENLYMFRTYSEMEVYFTDHTQGRLW